MFLRLINRFLAWLDARRDVKLQRQIRYATAIQAAQQATASQAIEALKSHTDLMKMWLTGLQNLDPGVAPYSSVVRDEDEFNAEVERIKARNVDKLSPNEWQSEIDFTELMKELQ